MPKLLPLPPIIPLLPSNQCRLSSSRSGSSHNWLTRQRSDPFVRSRSTAYVARSAFKLLELQEKTRVLRPGAIVVDLGAAPGGWVQVAAEVVCGRGTGKGKEREGGGMVVGVDLLPLSKGVLELEGVHALQGDFLDPRVQAQLVALLGRGTKVDVVLSDMLANMSGNPLKDAQSSIDLCEAALAFALVHLRRNEAVKGAEELGGKPQRSPPALVMKCLQSGLVPAFQKTLRSHFQSVRWDKPSSSRPESREGYLLCSGLKDDGPLPTSNQNSTATEDNIFF